MGGGADIGAVGFPDEWQSICLCGLLAFGGQRSAWDALEVASEAFAVKFMRLAVLDPGAAFLKEERPANGRALARVGASEVDTQDPDRFLHSALPMQNELIAPATFDEEQHVAPYGT